MRAPWGGIFKTNEQELLESSCLSSGLGQQLWEQSTAVGVGQGDRAEEPQCHAELYCAKLGVYI